MLTVIAQFRVRSAVDTALEIDRQLRLLRSQMRKSASSLSSC